MPGIRCAMRESRVPSLSEAGTAADLERLLRILFDRWLAACLKESAGAIDPSSDLRVEMN